MCDCIIHVNVSGQICWYIHISHTTHFKYNLRIYRWREPGNHSVVCQKCKIGLPKHLHKKTGLEIYSASIATHAEYIRVRFVLVICLGEMCEFIPANVLRRAKTERLAMHRCVQLQFRMMWIGFDRYEYNFSLGHVCDREGTYLEWERQPPSPPVPKHSQLYVNVNGYISPGYFPLSVYIFITHNMRHVMNFGNLQIYIYYLMHVYIVYVCINKYIYSTYTYVFTIIASGDV